MKKTNRTLLTCLFCTSLFLAAGANNAHAITTAQLEPVRVYGNVTKEGEGRLHLNNSNPEEIHPDIVVTVSEDTRILDATTGLPVPFENIRDGEVVYAYIGPAMTLSLPPMANATMVLCNIPADYKVPEYVKVLGLTWNEDRTIARLQGTNGREFTLPANCPTLPYLTRNIVTIDDLTPGRTCLLWSAPDSDTATNIVIFPDDMPETQEIGPGIPKRY